jgi:Leucine-rich repeat (LRR) protein
MNPLKNWLDPIPSGGVLPGNLTTSLKAKLFRPTGLKQTSVVFQSFLNFELVCCLFFTLLCLAGCGSSDNADLPSDVHNQNLGDKKKVEEVEISDPYLQTCIDNYNITYVFELQTLVCNYLGISDLTGLENFTELVHLELDNNFISDISEFSQISKLTELHLRNNSITDISPIAVHTNLSILDLEGNSVSSINALQHLAELSTVSLYNNHVSDITPLENATKLTSINLGFNSIENLSPLANLTRLNSLYLESNQISDITPLNGLTGLFFLTLNGNKIANVSALNSLTGLQVLWLQDNLISDGVNRLVTLTQINPNTGYKINLSGNNTIPCTQLNTLELALPDRVVRPETCQ